MMESELLCCLVLSALSVCMSFPLPEFTVQHRAMRHKMPHTCSLGRFSKAHIYFSTTFEGAKILADTSICYYCLLYRTIDRSIKY